MTDKRSRTLLIGLDAADPDFVDTHLDELPSLRALAAGGIDRLESTASSLAASVWPTFYTGSLPGEHGLYYPMQWDAGAMKLHRVPDERARAEPFWYELARQGVRAATVDVQMIWPGDPEGGFELINWGSQSYEQTHCNRADLSAEIQRRFGTHPMGPDVPVRKGEGRKNRLIKDILTGVGRRGEMARWLLAQVEWDLGIVVFSETHRAGHYFAADEETSDAGRLLEVYKAVDAEIGRIAASGGEGTSLVVFSLHGMGANQSLVHFVPEIVRRFNNRFLGRDVPGQKASSREGRGPMRRLRELLPGPLQEGIALLVPESVRDWVTTRVYAGGIDWSRTPAFALPSGTEGAIRLNLEGRERNGVLSPGAEQERYLSELEAVLLGLSTQAGTPAVREVVRVQDRYPGANSHELPDMSIVWQLGPATSSLHSPELGVMTGGLRAGRGGNHRDEGFFVAGGARAEEIGFRPSHIVDLARFTRELLGVGPIGERVAEPVPGASTALS